MFSEVKNNINWLAQCKKRMYYPINRSDHAGLTAFEYGWKSFNNLYSEFKVDTDKEKMRACSEKYINAEKFIQSNKKYLINFCDIEHKVYMTDKQYADLTPRIAGQVKKLKKSIDAADYRGAMTHLLACLYTIRNARVHGSFGTGESRFSFLPRVIYQINKSILISKLSVSEKALDDAINAAITNL